MSSPVRVYVIALQRQNNYSTTDLETKEERRKFDCVVTSSYANAGKVMQR